MHEGMEHFTAASLRRFISQPPPSRPEPDAVRAETVGEGARTARGRRVSEVLANAAHQPEEKMSAEMHDALVREHLGELVRTMVAEGRLGELRAFLEEHRHFLNDILAIVEKNQA